MNPPTWNRPLFDVAPLEGGQGLRLFGELDLSTVADLVAALDTLPDGAGVLDLKDLSFMDGHALHAFERYARTRNGDGPLVLANASTQVRRLFELTGADRNPDIELRPGGPRG